MGAQLAQLLYGLKNSGAISVRHELLQAQLFTKGDNVFLLPPESYSSHDQSQLNTYTAFLQVPALTRRELEINTTSVHQMLTGIHLSTESLSTSSAVGRKVNTYPQTAK